MATTETDPAGPITSSRHRPGGSLIAAATRITGKTLRDWKPGKGGQDWQADAWTMFDLVGEQHFLATTLANRLGQARLYVGRLPDDPTDPPEPVEEGPVADAFDSFGGSHGEQAQLVSRLGVNLFVAGDGWLVGIPTHLLPGNHEDADDNADPGERIAPYGPDGERILSLSDLDWRMLSVAEVQFDQSRVTLKLGSSTDEQVKADADDLFLVRVWRPHPQRWWEADSPTRASLPVLRELVGLTEHVSAQVDSRLAGAGVFIVPQSARDALLQRMGTPEDAEDDYDPLTESLMEAMITPIKDRSNASAYVPLLLAVPDESAEHFRYITFSAPLDAEARNLREEAIRRLALGQDCPPEILLGVGDMNHWGGWLVREDTITTHIEPPLALICDALTTQFLRPVLIQDGMDPEMADEYVIWYDVSQMIMRPSRTADAKDAHQAGVISDEAYRDVLGFSEQDAPKVAENDPAISLTFDLIKGAPSLAQTPGIPALVEQIRSVMSGAASGSAPTTDGEEPAPSGDGDIQPPSDTINDVDLPDDTGTPPPAEVTAAGKININFDGQPDQVFSAADTRAANLKKRLAMINNGRR